LRFGILGWFQNPGWRWSQGNSQRPRNPLTYFGWIHDKSQGWCIGLGPSDSMWIAVKPKRLKYEKVLKDSDDVRRHLKLGLVL